MATRHHQWREITGKDTAAVCRWLASQVRRLLKRVELLENPRLALKAEVLAEISSQRTEEERLAAEAEKQAEQLAGTEDGILALNTELPMKDEVPLVEGGHRVEGAKWTYESLKKERHVQSPTRKKRGTRGDDKDIVTSVDEGHDINRDTAERNDVAKETMSATASWRKRWTNLTPNSKRSMP